MDVARGPQPGYGFQKHLFGLGIFLQTDKRGALLRQSHCHLRLAPSDRIKAVGTVGIIDRLAVIAKFIINFGSHPKQHCLTRWIAGTLGIFKPAQDVAFGILRLVCRHIRSRQSVKTRRSAVGIIEADIDVDTPLGILHRRLEIAKTHMDNAEKIQTTRLIKVWPAHKRQCPLGIVPGK